MVTFLFFSLSDVRRRGRDKLTQDGRWKAGEENEEKGRKGKEARISSRVTSSVSAIWAIMSGSHLSYGAEFIAAVLSLSWSLTQMRLLLCVILLRLLLLHNKKV